MNTFTKIIPIIDETKVVKRVGIKTIDGFLAPCSAISCITERGKSCKDVAEITKSRVFACSLFCLSKYVIEFIAVGVDNPEIPSKDAVKLRESSLIVFSSFTLNSFFIKGEKSLDIFLDAPLLVKI